MSQQVIDENSLSFIIQEQLNSNLAGAIFLVISNLAIVPSILLSFYLHEEDSAIAYFNVFVASVLYHSCRSDFNCVVPYVDHRKLDYLFVYFAVLWTLTTGLGKSHIIPYRIRLVVFNLFFLPVAILVVGNYEGHWVQLVGGLFPALVMIAVANHYGVHLFRRIWWAVAALAVGAAAGLFMFVMPYSTYEWSHSVWHILSMTALFFLIYSTKRRYRNINPYDDPERYPQPAPAPLIAQRRPLAVA